MCEGEEKYEKQKTRMEKVLRGCGEEIRQRGVVSSSPWVVELMEPMVGLELAIVIVIM